MALMCLDTYERRQHVVVVRPRHVERLRLTQQPADSTNHSSRQSAFALSVQVEQVCVQLPTSADNVTLLALLLNAPCCCAPCCCGAPDGRTDRSISPARRAHSSKPAAAACSGQWENRRTHKWTPYRHIEPAAYIATSVKNQHYQTN